MYVNTFKNIKTKSIDRTLTISHLLLKIRGDKETINQIETLRQLGKTHPKFESEKIKLPSVNWNFTFEEKVSNGTILGPTGYIYIDVDNCPSIDLTNPYIFACWKSISTTGYGILVRVEGLTFDNFSNTYLAIANKLGVKADNGAKKATQCNIISLDDTLFTNYYSTKYIVSEEDEKVSFGSILEENSPLNEKEGIGELLLPNDTFLNTKLRFNNIDTYFTNEDKFIYFTNEKEKIVEPFYPKRIEEGKRNSYMFCYLSQIALLNPMAGQGLLIKIANSVNDKFVTKYDENKITSIVASVINKRKEGTLQVYKNKERRIIFNPNIKINRIEKMEIMNKEMGRIKTDKTKLEIYSAVEGWDFNNGKITQEGISKVIGKTIITVKRNWNDVKDLVKSMNMDNKDGITNYQKTPSQSEEKNEVDTLPVKDENVQMKVPVVGEKEIVDDNYGDIICNGYRVKKEYEEYWKYIYNENTKNYFNSSNQEMFNYACKSLITKYKNK